MTKFFPGTIELQRFDFMIDNGVRIVGTINERWVELLSRSIFCGEKHKRTIVRTIGIEKSYKEDFESVIKGNLGVKGVASIESNLKKISGLEVNFKSETSVTEVTEFEAPKCGLREIIIYQLVRQYDIMMVKESLFKWKRELKFTLAEYLDQFYDKSNISEIDPSCGCNKPSTKSIKEQIDGMLSFVLKNNYQIDSEYTKSPEGKIKLNNTDIVLDEEDWRILTGRGAYKIKSSLFPDYIRFLAGIQSEETMIRVDDKGTHLHKKRRTVAV